MFKDRYEPGEVIGCGASGRVFLAVDKKLNIKRAVKEISGGKGAGNEFYFLKSLRHNALPAILDIYEENGCVYIVMDHIEGVNLRELREREGPIGEPEVVSIAISLCDILGYLHGQKEPVVYRDLKPANIIRTPEGEIKLVDLGACAVYKEKGNLKLSVGSPRYAAPEQLAGGYSPLSDIFSLGKTMEALLPDRVSYVLRLVISRCTRQEPERRFPDTVKVRAALEFAAFCLIFKKYFRVVMPVCLTLGMVLMIAAWKAGVAGAVTEGPEAGGLTEAGALTEGEALMEEKTLTEEKALTDPGRDPGNNGKAVPEARGGRVGEGNLQEIKGILKEVSSQLSEGSQSVTGLLEKKLLLENIRDEINVYLSNEENGEEMMEEMREYRIADLSMLSTICKLLGQKDASARKGYFGKAADYIEELISIKGVKERPVYRMKLSDLVYIKDELGQESEAIRYLQEWENEHPHSGKEFYFAHACMLLKKEGNEKALEELYEKMKDSGEVTEDFRYEEISRQIRAYLRRRQGR